VEAVARLATSRWRRIPRFGGGVAGQIVELVARLEVRRRRGGGAFRARQRRRVAFVGGQGGLVVSGGRAAAWARGRLRGRGACA